MLIIKLLISSLAESLHSIMNSDKVRSLIVIVFPVMVSVTLGSVVLDKAGMLVAVS